PQYGQDSPHAGPGPKNGEVRQSGRGRHVLIFSTEMGAKPLAQRLLAAESGNPLSRVMGGPVAMHEAEHMGAAALQFFTSNDGVSIWIDETPGLTVTDIRARAREFVAKHGKAVIFVD